MRDGDKCYYADENSLAPLWKGLRFPMSACVSGWCMQHSEVVTIPDIYQDPRVPVDAYRPTFVKSLCLVPIRLASPIGAIGCYWASHYEPTPEEIKTLQILANSSAVALENLELRNAVLSKSLESEANATKSRDIELYLHTLAHDLKSPLGTLMGMAELLIMHSGAQLDARANEYLSSMTRAGNRLNRQIERVLSLYKMTGTKVQRAQVDLSRVAADIAEGLKTQYPGRNCEIRIAPGLSAYADPDLIRVALENLLGNSFKYSQKREKIAVEFGKQGEAFCIRDNGVGFDPAAAHRLFRPLERLHSGSDFAGTGLGLASVARIVELHGGRVWAEAEVDRGAAFYFMLGAA